jgi:hypothetical protein
MKEDDFGLLASAPLETSSTAGSVSTKQIQMCTECLLIPLNTCVPRCNPIPAAQLGVASGAILVHQMHHLHGSGELNILLLEGPQDLLRHSRLGGPHLACVVDVEA